MGAWVVEIARVICFYFLKKYFYIKIMIELYIQPPNLSTMMRYFLTDNPIFNHKINSNF